MQTLTSFGNLLGSTPLTHGKSLFVSAGAGAYTVNGRPGTASDGNDGLSPYRALATLTQAQVLATASAGDVIYLLPGTHTVTASLAASKAGVTYIGLPYLPSALSGVRSMRPQATVTGSASDEVINLTAADCTFINLRMLPVTAKTFMDYTVAAHRLRVLDCLIDLTTATAHAATVGIAGTAATHAVQDVVIRNCVMKESNAGTSNGAALDLSAAVNFLVQGCHIWKEYLASSGAWTAAIMVNDNATGTFADNRFVANGGGAGDAISAGVLGVTMTLAGIVTFERNLTSVNVTKMASTFAAADVHLVLNYIATVAGGTGGTLITASA